MIKNRRNIFIYAGFLMALSVGLTVLMMPRGRLSQFSDYREGTLAHENVSAPFDFEILRTDEELRDVREKIAANVPPVFSFNDTLNLHLFKKYYDFCSDFDRLLSIKKSISSLPSDTSYQSLDRDLTAGKTSFFGKYGLSFDDVAEAPIISDPELRKSTVSYLRSNLNSMILDTPKKDFLNQNNGKFILLSKNESTENSVNDFVDISIKKQRDINFIKSVYEWKNDDSLKYSEKILDSFSKPSLQLNRSLTDSLVHKAMNDVPLAEGLVKKGDIIVVKNSAITKNTLKVLRSLELKYKEMGGGQNSFLFKNINLRRVSGKIIIASLFYIILLLMLFFNRTKYFYSFKSLSLLFLIIILHMLSVYLSFRYIEGFSPYLVAMPVTSVLIAVFFDMRVSFVATIVSSVLTSILVGNNFLFIFVPAFSGLVTMYAVHRIRDIFQFIYKTVLFTFIGAVLPGIGFYLILNSSFEELFTVIYHSAVISAVSPLIALTLLTIIERVFKLPTDITLLQLSDMSRPLLRKLQTEAPGTYHHSVTVGNLAEAAAEAINANSLLARVGAYYHDIGKTFKAAYFIENQQNAANKHDKIPPNQSAFILSAHVKEGIKLAREYRLPEIIIDFIRTHHGTTRMEFFYNKALSLAKAEDEKVSESIYRYHGPKPNSKETAIVMISDIVEAKCRTESSANADRFRQIINDIILEKLQSGELDECDIKINDLSKIREAMIPVMTGMYHQRIKYPSRKPDINEQRKEIINPEKINEEE